MRNKVSLLVAMFLVQVVMAQEIDQQALDKQLHGYYPDEQAPGIAVRISQHGKLKYSFHQGLAHLEEHRKIDDNTHFRMASVSKQITASAIYRLIETGKMKISDPLDTYFDELPDKLKTITVQQLLNHSSGILDYESLLPEQLHKQLTDLDVLQYIKQKNTVYFPAGSAFRYSNTGYCLLALVVEKVSGKPFSSFVQQELFLPADVTDGLVYFPYSQIQQRAYGYHPVQNFYVYADQSLTSATQGDGGVYFSPINYHTWMNNRLTTKFHNADIMEFIQANNHPVKDNIAYSMGWFYTIANNQPILFHSGESTGFHNIVYVNIEKDLIISFFGNRDDTAIAKAFEAVLKATGEKNPISDTKDRPLFDWLNQVYANE
ncbi:beta-lactamase family protein [Sphingobacterium sp. SRCM116780]|uniref:serine hydrolase domain-containing protein n=1 Tax=Sphingobacterium sp. SRCM116780 TaxID=2907623 RepID=UPI001F1DD5DF|nr:serine hydrolase domain-containing protein [Sphingobacterium sp. SRCM116780]UIR57094.1 beta-lactamase family protein [Sphingobacterium sp. SRCM116780]